MNSQRDIRTMLGRLAQVAERSGAAIVLVSHHRKAGGRGPAVYRTLGSLAFTAVARAVWNVSRDPADGQRRLFVPVKMNIAPQPQALAYRIVDPGRVEWEPEPIALSADELSEESLADSDRGDRVAAAKIWLAGFLLAGPRSSGEVKSAARAAGIMPRPLWDAKRELKARAYKEGHTWKWCLPEHYIPQPGEYDHVLLGTGLPPLPNSLLAECLRTARGEAGKSGRW
jgi:putative DNA primase/helicase